MALNSGGTGDCNLSKFPSMLELYINIADMSLGPTTARNGFPDNFPEI